MKGVIYYDQTGRVLSIVWDGEPNSEGGIPFLEVDVPTGAVISEVDLSSYTPKLVFKEYPGSDYFALEDKVVANERWLASTNEVVGDHTKRISESDDTITNLELAITSLYEGLL